MCARSDLRTIPSWFLFSCLIIFLFRSTSWSCFQISTKGQFQEESENKKASRKVKKLREAENENENSEEEGSIEAQSERIKSDEWTNHIDSSLAVFDIDD